MLATLKLFGTLMSKKKSKRGRQENQGRRLNFEALEDRSLLAIAILNVGGVSVNPAANSVGNGWQYEAATSTLTLDGYYGDAITATGDLTINLKDNASQIVSPTTEDGINVVGNLTLKGSVDLTLQGGLRHSGAFVKEAGSTFDLYLGANKIDEYVSDLVSFENILETPQSSPKVVLLTSGFYISESVTMAPKNNITLLSSGDWILRRYSYFTDAPLINVGYEQTVKDSKHTVDTSSVLNLGVQGGMGTCTITIHGGVRWDSITGDASGATIKNTPKVLDGSVVAKASLIYNAGTLNIYDGVSLENNYNITNATSTDAFSQNAAGAVYVAGVNPSAKLTFPITSSNNRAVLNIYGGSLSENWSYSGTIIDYGVVNLYGGEVAGNVAEREGGGIRSCGYIFMYGGNVTGNYCVKPYAANDGAKGGGIHNSTYGYMEITGGTISGNYSAWRGGGIYIGGNGSATSVIGDKTATQNEGPLISDNIARIGGGLYVNSELEFYGGTITQNKLWSASGLTSHGSGIYVYIADSQTTNASVPTIKMSSWAKVDTSNLVYVSDVSYVFKSSGIAYSFIPIRVVGELYSTGIVMAFEEPEKGWRSVGVYKPLIQCRIDDKTETTITAANEELAKKSVSKFLLVSDVFNLSIGRLNSTPGGSDSYDSIVLKQIDSTSEYAARINDVFFRTYQEAMSYALMTTEKNIADPDGFVTIYIIHNYMLEGGFTLDSQYKIRNVAETQETLNAAFNAKIFNGADTVTANMLLDWLDANKGTDPGYADLAALKNALVADGLWNAADALNADSVVTNVASTFIMSRDNVTYGTNYAWLYYFRGYNYNFEMGLSMTESTIPAGLYTVDLAGYNFRRAIDATNNNYSVVSGTLCYDKKFNALICDCEIVVKEKSTNKLSTLTLKADMYVNITYVNKNASVKTIKTITYRDPTITTPNATFTSGTFANTASATATEYDVYSLNVAGSTFTDASSNQYAIDAGILYYNKTTHKLAATRKIYVSLISGAAVSSPLTWNAGTALTVTYAASDAAKVTSVGLTGVGTVSYTSTLTETHSLSSANLAGLFVTIGGTQYQVTSGVIYYNKGTGKLTAATTVVVNNYGSLALNAGDDVTIVYNAETTYITSISWNAATFTPSLGTIAETNEYSVDLAGTTYTDVSDSSKNYVVDSGVLYYTKNGATGTLTKATDVRVASLDGNLAQTVVSLPIGTTITLSSSTASLLTSITINAGAAANDTFTPYAMQRERRTNSSVVDLEGTCITDGGIVYTVTDGLLVYDKTSLELVNACTITTNDAAKTYVLTAGTLLAITQNAGNITSVAYDDGGTSRTFSTFLAKTPVLYSLDVTGFKSMTSTITSGTLLYNKKTSKAVVDCVVNYTQAGVAKTMTIPAGMKIGFTYSSDDPTKIVEIDCAVDPFCDETGVGVAEVAYRYETDLTGSVYENDGTKYTITSGTLAYDSSSNLASDVTIAYVNAAGTTGSLMLTAGTALTITYNAADATKITSIAFGTNQRFTPRLTAFDMYRLDLTGITVKELEYYRSTFTGGEISYIKTNTASGATSVTLVADSHGFVFSSDGFPDFPVNFDSGTQFELTYAADKATLSSLLYKRGTYPNVIQYEWLGNGDYTVVMAGNSIYSATGQVFTLNGQAIYGGDVVINGQAYETGYLTYDSLFETPINGAMWYIEDVDPDDGVEAKFVVNEKVTLSNHRNTFVDAANPRASGYFTVADGGVLELNGATIVNCAGALAGAVVLDSGASMTIGEGTVISDNVGAAASASGYVTVEMKDYTGAGAIYNYGGTVDMTGGTIENNSGKWGGIYNSSENAVIDSVVTGGQITGYTLNGAPLASGASLTEAEGKLIVGDGSLSVNSGSILVGEGSIIYENLPARNLLPSEAIGSIAGTVTASVGATALLTDSVITDVSGSIGIAQSLKDGDVYATSGTTELGKHVSSDAAGDYTYENYLTNVPGTLYNDDYTYAFVEGDSIENAEFNAGGDYSGGRIVFTASGYSLYDSAGAVVSGTLASVNSGTIRYQSGISDTSFEGGAWDNATRTQSTMQATIALSHAVVKAGTAPNTYNILNECDSSYSAGKQTAFSSGTLTVVPCSGLRNDAGGVHGSLFITHAPVGLSAFGMQFNILEAFSSNTKTFKIDNAQIVVTTPLIYYLADRSVTYSNGQIHLTVANKLELNADCDFDSPYAKFTFKGLRFTNITPNNFTFTKGTLKREVSESPLTLAGCMVTEAGGIFSVNYDSASMILRGAGTLAVSDAGDAIRYVLTDDLGRTVNLDGWSMTDFAGSLLPVNSAPGVMTNADLSNVRASIPKSENVYNTLTYDRILINIDNATITLKNGQISSITSPNVIFRADAAYKICIKKGTVSRDNVDLFPTDVVWNSDDANIEVVSVYDGNVSLSVGGSFTDGTNKRTFEDAALVIDPTGNLVLKATVSGEWAQAAFVGWDLSKDAANNYVLNLPGHDNKLTFKGTPTLTATSVAGSGKTTVVYEIATINSGNDYLLATYTGVIGAFTTSGGKNVEFRHGTVTYKYTTAETTLSAEVSGNYASSNDPEDPEKLTGFAFVTHNNGRSIPIEELSNISILPLDYDSVTNTTDVEATGKMSKPCATSGVFTDGTNDYAFANANVQIGVYGDVTITVKEPTGFPTTLTTNLTLKNSKITLAGNANDALEFEGLTVVSVVRNADGTITWKGKATNYAAKYDKTTGKLTTSTNGVAGELEFGTADNAVISYKPTHALGIFTVTLSGTNYGTGEGQTAITGFKSLLFSDGQQVTVGFLKNMSIAYDYVDDNTVVTITATWDTPLDCTTRFNVAYNSASLSIVYAKFSTTSGSNVVKCESRFSENIMQSSPSRLINITGTVYYKDGSHLSIAYGEVYVDNQGKIVLLDGERNKIDVVDADGNALIDRIDVGQNETTILLRADGSQITITQAKSSYPTQIKLNETMATIDYTETLTVDTLGKVTDEGGEIVVAGSPNVEVRLESGTINTDATHHQTLSSAIINMSGGTIVGNTNYVELTTVDTAEDIRRGNIAVWQLGTFKLSGTATVDPNNVVYLGNDRVITAVDNWSNLGNQAANPLTVDTHSILHGMNLVEAVLGNVDDAYDSGNSDAVQTILSDGRVVHFRDSRLIQKEDATGPSNYITIGYYSVFYYANNGAAESEEDYYPSSNLHPDAFALNQYSYAERTPAVSILTAGFTPLPGTSYYFVGWNTRRDGKGTWYFAGDAVTVTATTKLYAVWNANTVNTLSDDVDPYDGYTSLREAISVALENEKLRGVASGSDYFVKSKSAIIFELDSTKWEQSEDWEKIGEITYFPENMTVTLINGALDIYGGLLINTNNLIDTIKAQGRYADPTFVIDGNDATRIMTVSDSVTVDMDEFIFQGTSATFNTSADGVTGTVVSTNIEYVISKRYDENSATKRDVKLTFTLPGTYGTGTGTGETSLSGIVLSDGKSCVEYKNMYITTGIDFSTIAPENIAYHQYQDANGATQTTIVISGTVPVLGEDPIYISPAGSITGFFDMTQNGTQYRFGTADATGTNYTIDSSTMKFDLYGNFTYDVYVANNDLTGSTWSSADDYGLTFTHNTITSEFDCFQTDAAITATYDAGTAKTKFVLTGKGTTWLRDYLYDANIAGSFNDGGTEVAFSDATLRVSPGAESLITLTATVDQFVSSTATLSGLFTLSNGTLDFGTINTISLTCTQISRETNSYRIDFKGQKSDTSSYYTRTYAEESDCFNKMIGVDFENGYSTKNGGAIVVRGGTLVLEDCELRDNASQLNGGAIANMGELELIDCLITNSTRQNLSASGTELTSAGTEKTTPDYDQTDLTKYYSSNNFNAKNGGGIYNIGKATLTGTKIENMWVSCSSGALCNNYTTAYDLGVATLTDSTFAGNHAWTYAGSIDKKDCGYAGAIGNWGTMTISGCALERNAAELNGGAISNGAVVNTAVDSTKSLSSLTISGDSYFSNNKAYYGGAIINGTLLNVDATQFYNNESKFNGGAIYNVSYHDANSSYQFSDAYAYGVLNVGETSRVFFNNNYALHYGGAIAGAHLYENTTNWESLSIQQATFNNNSADHGGAIAAYVTTDGKVANPDVVISPKEGNVVYSNNKSGKLNSPKEDNVCDLGGYNFSLPTSAALPIAQELGLTKDQICYLSSGTKTIVVDSGTNLTADDLDLTEGENALYAYIEDADGFRSDRIGITIDVVTPLPALQATKTEYDDGRLIQLQLDAFLFGDNSIQQWTVHWDSEDPTATTRYDVNSDSLNVYHYYDSKSEDRNYHIMLEIADSKGLAEGYVFYLFDHAVLTQNEVGEPAVLETFSIVSTIKPTVERIVESAGNAENRRLPELFSAARQLTISTVSSPTNDEKDRCRPETNAGSENERYPQEKDFLFESESLSDKDLFWFEEDETTFDRENIIDRDVARETLNSTDWLDVLDGRYL